MSVLGRIAGRVERRKMFALAAATVLLLAMLPAVDLPQRAGELTVMVRPMSGLVALGEAMGA